MRRRGAIWRRKLSVLTIDAAYAPAIVGLLLLLPCTVMAQDEGGSPWVRYTLKQR